MTRLALGLSLAAALPTFAQEQSVPTRERRQHDEAFKLVDAYIVSNLQESLELSDEQFVKLLPLVKRLQSDRRDLAVRRKRALADMNRMLDSGSGSERPGRCKMVKRPRSAATSRRSTPF
jgi:hypothetical protein